VNFTAEFGIKVRICGVGMQCLVLYLCGVFCCMCAMYCAECGQCFLLYVYSVLCCMCAVFVLYVCSSLC